MKEALKLALEALENHCGNYKLDDDGVKRYIAACDAIKEALSQPEQEPVATVTAVSPRDFIARMGSGNARVDISTAIYTAPPKRPWVGLTNEETDALRSKTPPSAGIDFDLRCRDFARAIEAKLKEKNT